MQLTGHLNKLNPDTTGTILCEPKIVPIVSFASNSAETTGTILCELGFSVKRDLFLFSWKSWKQIGLNSVYHCIRSHFIGTVYMILGKRVVPSSRDNPTCSLWEILSISTTLKWFPDPNCPRQKGQTVYMEEVITGWRDISPRRVTSGTTVPAPGTS